MKKWFLFLVGFPSTAIVLRNPKVGSIKGDSRELKLELKDKSDLIKESRRGQGAAGRGGRARMDCLEEFTGFGPRGSGKRLWAKTQQEENILTSGSVPQCIGWPV